MEFITEKTPWYTRMKLFRIKAELTQMQMADRLGIDHRRYWGWEKGENIPRDENKKKIVDVLAAELPGLTEEMIFKRALVDFNGLERRKETGP